VRRSAPARLAAATAAVLLSACAPTAALMTPPPTVSPGPGRGDETTGGVTFGLRGASATTSYGPWRVTGDGIALTYAGDGAWKGTWNGLPARFQASQGLVTGPTTQISVDEVDLGLRLHGTWGGVPVDVTVGKRGLRGTIGANACSLDLATRTIGVAGGPVICAGVAGTAEGTLELLGEAVLVPDVLLPQFVFGVLSVLPAAPLPSAATPGKAARSP
jgi:hypothetical protein